MILATKTGWLIAVEKVAETRHTITVKEVGESKPPYKISKKDPDRKLFSSVNEAGTWIENHPSRKELKINLEPYNAGRLAGDDDSPTCWWHEYIRSELAAAHDHYQAQIENNAYYLSKDERKHLLLALSCMESELPEHESLLKKLSC